MILSLKQPVLLQKRQRSHMVGAHECADQLSGKMRLFSRIRSQVAISLWGLRHVEGVFAQFTRRCVYTKRRVALFRVAGVALCDIPTCFMTCQKSFCGWHAQYFCVVWDDELQFSWQAQHFGDLHRHFAWQVQHFRCVALRVLRVALSGLREIVTTCNFCGRGRIFMR